MNDNWGFSFAGRTIDYFGSKAITSDITAIFELIKNSRDANTKKVTIHFQDLTTNARIKVCDNGDGMSEKDVKEKWMVIGTDSRLKEDKTKNGKPVWGEMGIGRMACQKLGGLTELVSVKNKQRIKMTFDWSLFENPEITVDKITFPVEIGRSGEMESGLALEIKNLKSKWTPKRINDLKEELSVLITNKTIDDISIVVRVEKHDGETIGTNYTNLLKRVTDNAPFKMKAKFDGSRLTASIFTRIGQKGKWEKQEVNGHYDDTTVGPFTMDIFHFPRASGKDKSSLIETYYNKRIGTDKLEAFLKDHYGMYLYRDGAWMKPYGGNMDWLSLEAGARQETSKIGLKQVFGQVFLSKKENPDIKPASHRETLIENDAFMDLKKIMREPFEILRNYMKRWKKEQEKKKFKEMGAGTTNPEEASDRLFDRMKTFTDNLSEKQKKDARLTLGGIHSAFSQVKEESERRLSEMSEVQKYTKNLATLGIATSFMARQVTEPLKQNMQIVSEGEEMREKIKKQGWQLSEKEIVRTEEMLEAMKHNQSQILHFMRFVDVLSVHIVESMRRNKRYTQVDVLECWQTVQDGFQGKKEELDIKTTHEWNNPRKKNARERIVVKIDRIDLECILTNLYLNSIESLRHTRERKRKVKYHYWHYANCLYIEFSDNGRGIPKNQLEDVFEPFKFGHSQDNDEMHGHGLGLYLVKKIMENYAGTVDAVDVKEGAKIRMVFPDVGNIAS